MKSSLARAQSRSLSQAKPALGGGELMRGGDAKPRRAAPRRTTAHHSGACGPSPHAFPREAPYPNPEPKAKLSARKRKTARVERPGRLEGQVLWRLWRASRCSLRRELGNKILTPVNYRCLTQDRLPLRGDLSRQT